MAQPIAPHLIHTSLKYQTRLGLPWSLSLGRENLSPWWNSNYWFVGAGLFTWTLLFRSHINRTKFLKVIRLKKLTLFLVVDFDPEVWLVLSWLLVPHHENVLVNFRGDVVVSEREVELLRHSLNDFIKIKNQVLLELSFEMFHVGVNKSLGLLSEQLKLRRG